LKNEKYGEKKWSRSRFFRKQQLGKLADGTETMIGLFPMKTYVPLGPIDRPIVKADENLGIKTNVVFNVI